MTIKYLLFVLISLFVQSDNFPAIHGRVTECRVDFNFRSEIEMTDGELGVVTTTISNNKPVEFCIEWTHANIACDNRDPCIITAVGKVPISSPYPLPNSLIRIGSALRCSTYRSCYVDRRDLRASSGAKITEMTCFNANGETSKVIASGLYSSDFKTSILEINMSPKTEYIIGLTSNFKVISRQDSAYQKVSSSQSLNKLLTTFDVKSSGILNNWIDTTIKHSTNTVYYLLDNQSEDPSQFRFASEMQNSVTLTKFRSIIVTPSKDQFIGFVAYAYSTK